MDYEARSLGELDTLLARKLKLLAKLDGKPMRRKKRDQLIARLTEAEDDITLFMARYM